MNSQSPQNDEAKVFDFNAFKKKKSGDGELARGRSPLYMSHLEGKVTGSPHFKRPEAGDFGDRLQRIRTSLEKINGLIAELKKMSASDGQKAETNAPR